MKEAMPGTSDVTIDTALALFLRELETADLVPKRRKRRRLDMAGMLYGQAGAVLRILQASPDKAVLEPEPGQPENRWPFLDD